MFIVETIHGTYFYHLTETLLETGSGRVKALCGAGFVGMMKTHPPMPLSYWGHRSHLKERYCTVCDAVLKKRGWEHA